MRKVAINRGIILGGLIDHASQMTIGSVRNLPRFANARFAMVPFLFCSSYATNFAYSKDPKLLGIRYDWLRDNPDYMEEPADKVTVVDNGVQAGVPTPKEGAGTIGDINDPAGDPDAWWIETRMTFESILSPDIKYPIITELEPYTRDKMVRFGSCSLDTVKTDAKMVDRIVSTAEINAEVITYRHKEVTGEEIRRVRWTNDKLPSHYVHWHKALDSRIGGNFSGRLDVLEHSTGPVCVRTDTRGDLGSYSGMDVFSGLRGL
jgi:hypothetical protein